MAHKKSMRCKTTTYYWVPAIALLGIVYHWCVWTHIYFTRDVSWPQILNYWDSGWYSSIIEAGYHGANFAFYPFYPGLVKIIQSVLPLTIAPQILGACLSTLFFLFFSAIIWLLLQKKSAPQSTWGLIPESPLAWFLFVWSPASYIFQSHHTEAIFLLLSFGAFYFCQQKRFIYASILAGLCALTKNQGIFTAVATGFWWSHTEKDPLSKLKYFFTSGFISGSLFAVYPLYCYVKTGDFTAFYSAQNNWRPEMTIGSYVKTLWFGNAWQNTNYGSLIRYGFFFILVACTVGVWRRNKPLGLYVGLYVGVMPLSGEFVGTFRYSSVLWPVWYLLAEWSEATPNKIRKALVTLLLMIFIYLNHQLTRGYALGSWSY